MTARRSSTINGGETAPLPEGCYLRPAHSPVSAAAGPQDEWATARTHTLTGEWVAIFTDDRARQWTTEPVDALVLQLHRDGRSRVVPARLRDGATVLLDDPRPTASVPAERLEYWLTKARESQ